jgi:hypothetical protein
MDGLKRRGHDSRRDTDVEPRLSRDGAVRVRPITGTTIATGPLGLRQVSTATHANPFPRADAKLTGMHREDQD